MAKADIGLIGLAVMGENLILNMESKGFTVACYNRTVSKVDKFIEDRAKGKNIIGCHSIEELVENLEKPRKVMLLVKDGEAVDAFIEKIIPYLEDGDIILDGANSAYSETIRCRKLKKGVLYISTHAHIDKREKLGEGAGIDVCPPEAWKHIGPILQEIGAQYLERHLDNKWGREPPLKIPHISSPIDTERHQKNSKRPLRILQEKLLAVPKRICQLKVERRREVKTTWEFTWNPTKWLKRGH